MKHVVIEIFLQILCILDV